MGQSSDKTEYVNQLTDKQYIRRLQNAVSDCLHTMLLLRDCADKNEFDATVATLLDTNAYVHPDSSHPIWAIYNPY